MIHCSFVELDPTEIVGPKKNTDPAVNCQNALYQNRCLICNQIDPSLINHYRIVHPESDVFISRPTPQMAKRMREKSDCSFFKDGKINAFCVFCEKSESMTGMEWRKHLLLHTGELEFYCTDCRTQSAEKYQHGNCSIDDTISAFDLPVASDAAAAAAAAAGDSTAIDNNISIMLYMCTFCNFVQLHRAHIVRHLEHEHGLDASSDDRNIENVTFIPNLKPLTWTILSDYKYVTGKL